MTHVENDKKRDSSHEFNLYVDRQLQTKLLQVDDDSDVETYEIKLSKHGSNIKSVKSKYDPKVEDVMGWFPGAKFLSRRVDNQSTSNPKSENSKSNTPFIHPWKDYRNKKEDPFVFKHYSDNRKYIEQYRNEHGFHNTRSSSGTVPGEQRRVVFQQQPGSMQQHSPTIQQLQQQQPNWPLSSALTNHHGSIHYSNRKEQLGTLVTPSSTTCTCNHNTKQNHTEVVSSQGVYAQRFNKQQAGTFARNNTTADLRPYLDSDNSSESGELRCRPSSRRSNSASSLRNRSVTHTPTKITVPANPNTRAYPIQALTIQQNTTSTSNGKHEVCPSPRPLDNLNCVAPEKQRPLSNDPQLTGLTWEQKIAVLRAVNKPAAERQTKKRKRQKLKFIKEGDQDGTEIERNSAHEQVYMWSTEQEQLYEQRRIKHIVEQARLKGGKRLDWVYEAQVRARGIDWGTGRMKCRDGADVSGDDHGAGSGAHTRGRELSNHVMNGVKAESLGDCEHCDGRYEKFGGICMTSSAGSR